MESAPESQESSVITNFHALKSRVVQLSCKKMICYVIFYCFSGGGMGYMASRFLPQVYPLYNKKYNLFVITGKWTYQKVLSGLTQLEKSWKLVFDYQAWKSQGICLKKRQKSWKIWINSDFSRKRTTQTIPEAIQEYVRDHCSFSKCLILSKNANSYPYPNTNLYP